MRGMMEMRGIRMGMQGIGVGMRGIRVGMREIGNRNEGNQGENLRIEVEMIKKKMRRGIKTKGNVRIYKNIVLTLWYEKQFKKII